jgi:hypothetical protein
VNGPATVRVEAGDTTSSTTLVPDGYIGPGATVVNDPYFTDPDDTGNTVWRFSVQGGVANAFLGTADLGSDPVLDSGFDLSGDGTCWLVFDLKVISISPGTMLTVKIDSGYLDMGQVTLTPSQYTLGSWRRVVVDFEDLVDLGAGLDLGNVVNAFVMEVTGGDAEFYLDNIFITRTCPSVEVCNATVKTKQPTAIGTLIISDIGSSRATVSFATTPASAATIIVRLHTDDPASPPIFTTTSSIASQHNVELTGLWSAARLRVEVTAGPAQTAEVFRTADPDWNTGPCRIGPLVLPIDGNGAWSTYTDRDGTVSVEPTTGCGGSGNGVRMRFDLGRGEWVVASGNSFANPVDLTAYTHLWVPYRGTPGVSTALEVKLRDASGALSMARLDQGAGLPVWRSWAIDLREFRAQLGSLDLSAVTGLEVAFSSPLSAAGQRSGVVELGDLSAWNLADVRPTVSGFERVNRDEAAMAGVAADLLARLQPHGFMPAWFELAPNWHLYANAMALIVFALEYERLVTVDDPAATQYEEAARLVADALVRLQVLSDRGGGWDDSYIVADGSLALRDESSRLLWVGSTAWAGISLIIARDILPDGNDYDAAISAATAFFASRQGCRAAAGLPEGSVTEGTEGNISSHLFLAAAAARGLGGAAVPDALATFIADALYDPVQQRFFCGVEVDLGEGFNTATCTSGGSGEVVRADARSCLDVIGNWGAEWLVRQGRAGDALAGFTYARHVFPTRSFGNRVVNGLGDIAGPWTPSVEIGAGQWAAAGGPDASYVLSQAEEHLCETGACQGAADDFSAGITWNTSSPGIAPGAWMYLAWHGGFWERL